ncbi:MAG: hypothetical protein GXP42_12785 [Chloroflexi bacterium]|nr:hypothetical protein [Chloroflexota bacterium]
MKLFVFKNDVLTASQAPFVLSIDATDDVIPPHTHFNAPIYAERSGNELVYNVELCGFRLEAETPEGLLAPSARLLAGLINMARLPTYVFAAGRSLQVYPVYTVDDEVLVTTPGGPIFRHVELAKVRSFLSEYLHTMEVLGAVDRVETLHVRGVDKNTLGLVRPRFYFKKRTPGENEFWAPVFRSQEGRTIYTYAASAKRETPLGGGQEVLNLQKQVAYALMADGRLSDPYDLRPDRLFVTDWRALATHLRVQPYSIHIEGERGKKLFIYRNGKVYITAEHRVAENRYNIFLGRNPFDLQERVALDFIRRGLVHSATAIKLVAE